MLKKSSLHQFPFYEYSVAISSTSKSWNEHIHRMLSLTTGLVTCMSRPLVRVSSIAISWLSLTSLSPWPLMMAACLMTSLDIIITNIIIIIVWWPVQSPRLAVLVRAQSPAPVARHHNVVTHVTVTNVTNITASCQECDKDKVSDSTETLSRGS